MDTQNRESAYRSIEVVLQREETKYSSMLTSKHQSRQHATAVSTHCP